MDNSCVLNMKRFNTYRVIYYKRKILLKNILCKNGKILMIQLQEH